MALVDTKTQQLIAGELGLSTTGIYDVDDGIIATKTANITGLEGSVTKVDANNETRDVLVGPASPSIAVDLADLPLDIKMKILGNVSDGKGGYSYGGVKPHVAFQVISEPLSRDSEVHFNFPNTIISSPSQNVGTDTSSAITRQDDNLTVSALSAKAYNGEPYKVVWTGADKYDQANEEKELFGGYTATTPSNNG